VATTNVAKGPARIPDSHFSHQVDGIADAA
jgi:hypothetical protein